MKKNKKALLVLSDGTTFEGLGFGASKLSSGEIIFNTSMTGYQEILTDPSYKGQIVVMTYPEIGNYGVNAADAESRGLFLSGFVIRELSSIVSNYRAHQSLHDYLLKNNVTGISEIDTRALVRHIRDKGAMQAVIAVGDKLNLSKLKKIAAALPGMEGQNLAKQVTAGKVFSNAKGETDFVRSQPVKKLSAPKKGKKKFNVIAYDFGIKTNILRLLKDSGCEVKIVPYNYPAEKILSDKKVDGVFLSNGPGDPAECAEAVTHVKKLLGKKPLFGICLGHQILSLALGAKTFKLKFGHHGGNQPVMDLSTKKVEITAQNHGFAVDARSLPKDVVVTHINLNDNTVEGIAHKKLNAFSVQYHPESAPGPHDSRYLFGRFVEMMQN